MLGLDSSLVAAFYELCDFGLDIQPLWGSASCKMELKYFSLSLLPALSFFSFLPFLLLSLFPLSSFFSLSPYLISPSPTHAPYSDARGAK